MSDRPPAALISVVGGECTGKSTLAAALGDALPAVVVSETLRDWVDAQGRVPERHEQEQVMATHRDSELSALRMARWVVSDSGPLMTAAYSIQYYGDDSLLPTAVQWTADSDLVVWCQADFAWQPDPQRDGADARSATQRILAEIFDGNPRLPVLPVTGSLDERVAAVLGAVARDVP